MTRDEVIDNLGTIMKSGTKAFLESIDKTKPKDSQLIGQAMSWFYSAFIVADKVTVRTCAAGQPADKGVFWESQGEGDYTVADIEKADRGTEITLHLREGEDEYLDDWRLRSIISKLPDHISYLHVEETKNEEDGTVTEKTNKAQALWTRNKSEISDEYKEFYVYIFLCMILLIRCAGHITGLKVNKEYTSLLYVPSKAPWDLWEP